MSSHPAYRPRGSQSQPSGGWGVIVPFFLAMIILIWPYAVWHGCKYGGQDLSGCGAESEWVWNARSWAACGIWWGFLVSLVVIPLVSSAGKRRAVRPPKGRLRAEVFPDGPPPAPPACLHRNAVKVDSSVVPGLIWQCWCPDCETGLPASFRLPCCGAEPGDGTQPARHAYNCPHLKGQPS